MNAQRRRTLAVGVVAALGVWWAFSRSSPVPVTPRASRVAEEPFEAPPPTRQAKDRFKRMVGGIAAVQQASLVAPEGEGETDGE